MSRIERRVFLASAAAAQGPGESPRSQFPWAAGQTYLNAAGLHPIPQVTAEAIDRYTAARLRGPSRTNPGVAEADIEKLRGMFAHLIHASADEVAFIASTQQGENIVAQALGLHDGKGNIVTDELHFHGSLYHYRMLAKQGLDVRIVKQRDWRIHLQDVERAVDGKTRLIATSLVSNLNGFHHDAQALSELAHAHKAYLFCDVIQAVGAMPLNVKALGIDFCSAATYKWLMGLSGLGFLYVRQELMERVLRMPHYGDRQYQSFTYHNLPGSPVGRSDFEWDAHHTARRFELGHLNEIAIAGELESLRYLQQLGVDNIEAHNLELTRRLRKEVAALGFIPITPGESRAPIAAFLAPDMPAVEKKLSRAKVAAKVKWNQLRISPAIFNDTRDVDRLLEAMA